MRITGGIHRGRVIKVPDGLEVRPTQDRVREALFNIIQNEIKGARFLDVFAGSGAVGLEAMSRGASSVTFVERNPRHIAFVRSNSALLKLAPEIVPADAYQYLASFAGAPFDIVYADPPYAMLSDGQSLEKLFALFCEIANNDTICVLEAPGEFDSSHIKLPLGFTIEELKRLGKKSVGKPSQIIFKLKKYE